MYQKKKPVQQDFKAQTYRIKSAPKTAMAIAMVKTIKQQLRLPGV